MRSKRQRYSSEFKAKVAIEALKEQKTLSQIASEFDIHPNQIGDWKKRLHDEAATIFLTQNNHNKKQDKLVERLYQQIGQLQVELDWLKKKSNF